MWTIREAERREAAAVRMLLRQACAEGAGRRFLVARAGELLVGAATWRASGGEKAGVRIEVAPSWRRQGVGRALVAALGPGRLTGQAAVEEAEACRALGFARTGGATRMEAAASGARPLAERWGVRPLREAAEVDARAVAALYRQWIGPEIPERLAAERLLANPALRVSAARHEGRLAAMVVWSRLGEVATLEAWAAEPRWRGSRLNAELFLGWGLQMEEAGVRRVAFVYEDGVVQTPRVAARFGARVVGRVENWARGPIECACT